MSSLSRHVSLPLAVSRTCVSQISLSDSALSVDAVKWHQSSCQKLSFLKTLRVSYSYVLHYLYSNNNTYTYSINIITLCKLRIIWLGPYRYYCMLTPTTITSISDLFLQIFLEFRKHSLQFLENLWKMGYRFYIYIMLAVAGLIVQLHCSMSPASEELYQVCFL